MVCGFFPGLFLLSLEFQILFGSVPTSNFANLASEELPLRKELWECEKTWFPEPVKFLPGMCTQTGEAMCAWCQRRV